MESQESHLRSRRAASAAGRIARGILAGHGGGARREANHRRMARSARGDIRSCHRYRLDHHRGASVRSDERRGGRLRGRHESSDSFRRGSDEPRVLLHDESGRRQAHDRRGARGAERSRGGRGAGGRCDARGHSRGDDRRQSDHASLAARDRSGGARRRTVRARDGYLVDVARERHRFEVPPQCAGLCAALHRRPRGRRRRRDGPVRAPGHRVGDDAAGGRRHQRRDRARQQRPARRLLEPHRSGVRGRTDQLRAARRSGGDRARAHRPHRRSSRASR